MAGIAPLLATRNLGKLFAGNRALDGVDFEARKGEVHAIVGANGAGKSTLMNILSGVLRPTEGEILLEGAPVRFDSPSQALASGIACVYQELSLVSQLDVARNVYLGREPKRAFGIVDLRALHENTAELLRRYGIEIQVAAEVASLSIAQQQMVELARALSFDSRILILDEPTAVLSLAEKENLFAIIRSLRSSGMAIVHVSHYLGEVLEIADRITVIRDGRVVATQPARETDVNELAAQITGETGATVPKAPIARQAMENGRELEICWDRPGDPVRLRLIEGEITGIAGLVGSGRSSLARAIAGAAPSGTGVTITRDGGEFTCRTTRDAIRRGIVYLTEDRKRDGLFGSLDLVANTTATSLDTFSAGFLRRPAAERRAAENMLERLRVVAARLDMPITSLSGGNQQKTLIARALMTGPKILICDEPTRGVDISAKAQIHDILRELAARGVAIMVISSENEEILSIADRILVMRSGRIVGELLAAEADETKLLVAISDQKEAQVAQ